MSPCVVIAADRGLQWLTGLGRPVLLLPDEGMEYRPAPDQATTRRGSRIEINGLGMRSSRFPATRAAGTALRILVLGDSVVFGGAATDQGELATELLADRLSDRLGAPVEVGNASAGSWGPANWLGFFRRHGSLDADLVIVVASGHDAGDIPAVGRWVPPGRLNPLLPALHELWRRLAPPPPPARHLEVERHGTLAALPDLDRLLHEVRVSGAAVRLLPFFTRSETRGAEPSAGSVQIRQRAHESGTPAGLAVPLDPGEGRPDAHRDELHPNAAGQRELADRLERLVASWREPPDAGPPPRS